MMSIKKIYEILEPLTRAGITKNPLDYSTTQIPRSIMEPLDDETREKVEKKLTTILSNRNIPKKFYIHFDLCTKICTGCPIGSVTSDDVQGTVNTLMKNIDLFSSKNPVEKCSVHFGGGSPSLMNAEQIKSVYNGILSNFRINSKPSISLEIHPEVARLKRDPEQYIKKLKEIGVTRLSVGIQDFNNLVLKRWNRGHTKEDAIKLYRIIEKHKLNTNIDLLYPLPNQTLKQLEFSLRTAFELNPDTIHVYFLWLTQEARDYLRYKKGKIKTHYDPIKADYLAKSLAEKYGYKEKSPELFSKKLRQPLKKHFMSSLKGRFMSSKFSHIKPISAAKKRIAETQLSYGLIGFGQKTHTQLFSGFDENYILWSAIPKNEKDSIADSNNAFNKMVNSGIKPYDRILKLGKEETIRFLLINRLKSNSLSKHWLNYFIKESCDDEIKKMVKNYLRLGLMHWEKSKLKYTVPGSMIYKYIIASFAPNNLLQQMVKKKKNREYFWFPNPEKVLLLKSIINSN